jgi:hypothetical protein
VPADVAAEPDVPGSSQGAAAEGACTAGPAAGAGVAAPAAAAVEAAALEEAASPAVGKENQQAQTPATAGPKSRGSGSKEKRPQADGYVRPPPSCLPAVLLHVRTPWQACTITDA